MEHVMRVDRGDFASIGFGHVADRNFHGGPLTPAHGRSKVRSWRLTENCVRLTLVIFDLPTLTYCLSLFFGSAGLPCTGWAMTNKPDSVYYAERLAAELKALETATNQVARTAHQELAERYAKLLADSDAAVPVSKATSKTSVN